MNDYLIYTSAGEAANVKQWAQSPRNYDIWITNYSDIPGLNQEYADIYDERKGSKFQNLKGVINENREQLGRYKAIMVADDDIIITPTALSSLFEISTNKELWLLQPAFSRYGKICHEITTRQLATDLRYVNFIEVTCPIFRTDKLLDFMDVYEPESTTCYGLDWWFLNFFGKDVMNKYAVSDTYYCTNPLDPCKPTRRREINRLNTHQQREQMWQNIRRRFRISTFPNKEFRCIAKRAYKVGKSAPGYYLEIIFAGPRARYVYARHKLRNRLRNMIPSSLKSELKQLLGR